MAETMKDGGPAFPVPTECEGFWDKPRNEGGTFTPYGMTLRDYFAAKALQGYMANPTSFGPDVPEEAKNNAAMVANICAAFSYLIADAMLKARMKP